MPLVCRHSLGMSLVAYLVLYAFKTTALSAASEAPRFICDVEGPKAEAVGYLEETARGLSGRS